MSSRDHAESRARCTPRGGSWRNRSGHLPEALDAENPAAIAWLVVEICTVPPPTGTPPCRDGSAPSCGTSGTRAGGDGARLIIDMQVDTIVALERLEELHDELQIELRRRLVRAAHAARAATGAALAATRALRLRARAPRRRRAARAACRAPSADRSRCRRPRRRF